MTTLPELLDDLDDEFADARRLVAAAGPGRSSLGPGHSGTGLGGARPGQPPGLLRRCRPAGHGRAAELFSAEAERAMARPGDPMQEHLDKGRAMDGDELLGWWDRGPRGNDACVLGRRSVGASPLVRTADGRACRSSRPD